jgi:type III pantothenate kinase
MEERLVLRPTNHLLLDIGNSRTKYAVFDGMNVDFSVDAVIDNHHLKTLVELSDKVLLSSVGHQDQVNDIRLLCDNAGKTLFEAKTEADSFGIQCAYSIPQNLGVDRWLAILAARQLTLLPVAVIDLGTAATCDIVIDKQHLGGWISPGFELMRSALLENTQKVFGDKAVPDSLLFGDATAECVNMGCLASLQGLVLSAQQRLQSQSDDHLIIVTGGNRQLIQKMSLKKTIFADNLVLKGLSLFI